MGIIDNILRIFGALFIFVIVLLLIGLFSPNSYAPILSELETSYMAKSLDIMANKPNEQLRLIGISMTEGCTDYRCRAMTVASKLLERQKYLQTAYNDWYIQDPLYTYEIGYGDCKANAMLFEAIYSNIGGVSRIECGETHCYNLVILDNETIYVDVTAFKSGTNLTEYKKQFKSDKNVTRS